MVNRSDCDWLSEHGLELSARYPGKWIAVREGQVIGVGDTLGQAEEQAARERPEHDFILERMNVEPDLPHVD